MSLARLLLLAVTSAITFGLCGGHVSAQQTPPAVTFNVSGENADLTEQLRASSLVLAAVAQEDGEASDIVSAALADYRRLVETLYGNGYYSGVVQIRLNGREAADQSLLSLPNTITSVDVSVDPGPPFRFGQISIAPLPPGLSLPDDFATGKPAQARVIQKATRTALGGWRDAGHAKAAPGSQRIVADHSQQTLAADIRIIPGPQVRFGNLIISGDSAVREERIREMTGFPTGDVFSPGELSDSVQRLRRTGTFSSVTVTEGEVKPDGSMDISVAVVDRKPRRYSFGAEVTSDDGVFLTGTWMHRNLRGGGERLRFDAEIGQLGGDETEADYLLRARYEIPAFFGPDTDLIFQTELESIDDPRFQSNTFSIGGGIKWYARNGIETQAGAGFLRSNTTYAFGRRDITLFTLPAIASWDRRNDTLDATRGTFFRVEATPYYGISGSQSGMRTFFDARGYRAFGSGRVVLAGRLQLGFVAGSDLAGTYPDFLFFSGGGGTVRGQPFESLDVDLGGGQASGGRTFLGTMLELRTGVTDTIGAVVFYDAGYIGAESFYDGSGEWHSGAGVGVRYDTGLGPLRLDVGFPVSGTTGDGMQIYIGIGQAF